MRVLVLVWGRQVETLQASPLLRTLAAGLPGATMTLACSPAAAQVARALEGAGEVLALRGLDPGGSPIGGLVAWARLRRRRFDFVVICGTAARPRLLAYLAGFSRRLGVGGGLTAVLLSDHVRPRPGENQAATWLRLAPLLGSGCREAAWRTPIVECLALRRGLRSTAGGSGRGRARARGPWRDRSCRRRPALRPGSACASRWQGRPRSRCGGSRCTSAGANRLMTFLDRREHSACQPDQRRSRPAVRSRDVYRDQQWDVRERIVQRLRLAGGNDGDVCRRHSLGHANPGWAI